MWSDEEHRHYVVYFRKHITVIGVRSTKLFKAKRFLQLKILFESNHVVETHGYKLDVKALFGLKFSGFYLKRNEF